MIEKIFQEISERLRPDDSQDEEPDMTTQPRRPNPRMNPALKIFTQGDTMEATIVETFEDGDEMMRGYGHRNPFRAIFVGTDGEALYESALDFAEGPDGGLPPGIAGPGEAGMALPGNPESKIEEHLEYMFEDFEPRVSVMSFLNAYPVTAVMITMEDEEAVRGLADYFAFLYEGYADVYVE